MEKRDKKKKTRILDIILLAVVAIIVFTPVGKPVKVWVNRLFSFGPAVTKEESREKLSDYNWQFVDDRGEPYNMSEAKGKVVFVNYWATWCPPCIAEMPSIQKLYNKYRNNPDIKFVFATTDPKDKVDQFMQNNNYDLPTFYMHSPAPDQLASNTIPITFLISKNGGIAISKKGAANWNSKKVTKTIDQLLKE